MKETINNLIEMVVGPVEINYQEEDNILRIEIKGDNAQPLIGDKGRILKDLQHLLRLLVKKQTKENIVIDLDINGYKNNKAIQLTKVAQEIADRVILMNEEKLLPPMSAYERRIIHLALEDRDDVFTESIDEGKERRVVVKPKTNS
jgi:spoIIIJ-associated protein